jgi:hypothetical protein
LHGQTSNRDPPDLCILSSWDYRHEPPALGCTSFEKCLFSLFAPLLVFTYSFDVPVLSSLYILDINPQSNEKLAKIFLHFCMLSLHRLASFTVRQLFIYLLSCRNFLT